jgi:hypothetical protein
MKLVNFTYTLLVIAVSSQEAPVAPQEAIDPYYIGSVVPQETTPLSKEKCPHPFEVGAVSLSAFFSNMEVACSNSNRDTGCLHRYYKIPNENVSPGGCRRRNEPPVMDAIVRKYDCRGAGNHWSFASEMVNRYNLTCNFVKRRPYY